MSSVAICTCPLLDYIMNTVTNCVWLLPEDIYKQCYQLHMLPYLIVCMHITSNRLCLWAVTNCAWPLLDYIYEHCYQLLITSALVHLKLFLLQNHFNNKTFLRNPINKNVFSLRNIFLNSKPFLQEVKINTPPYFRNQFLLYVRNVTVDLLAGHNEVKVRYNSGKL